MGSNPTAVTLQLTKCGETAAQSRSTCGAALPKHPRFARCAFAKTVWPSGLRRWLKAPVRKGVGSNPTAVIRALWQQVCGPLQRDRALTKHRRIHRTRLQATRNGLAHPFGGAAVPRKSASYAQPTDALRMPRRLHRAQCVLERVSNAVAGSEPSAMRRRRGHKTRHGTCGLVAMTSASHAEGRQFDPGQVYAQARAVSNACACGLAVRPNLAATSKCASREGRAGGSVAGGFRCAFASQTALQTRTAGKTKWNRLQAYVHSSPRNFRQRL